MNESTTSHEDRELLELLAGYPAPQPEPGFFDRALARAAVLGARRRRRRLAGGVGSLVAASLAVWVVAGMLAGSPTPDAPADAIPGVTMALEAERTVNLVFASADRLDGALLTVSLPPGIELAGFPGQREITWETSLNAGKNVLPLTLVALTPAGGEVLARLEHQQRNRTFRLRISVDRELPVATTG